MFRKLIGGLALLGVGFWLMFGTSVGSYVRTGYVQAVGYCKGQIPVQFKIERARHLVQELHPDIHKAARDIAVEEVRIIRLKDEIARAEKDRDEQQVAILAIRDQLKKGLASYKVGGREFSQADLERDLARRFKSFKRVSENLEQRSALLQARESKLIAARDTYQGLIETKRNSSPKSNRWMRNRSLWKLVKLPNGSLLTTVASKMPEKRWMISRNNFPLIRN